ncbi:UDP-glucose 4-epimerase GalE [Candidatus Saccharibacteria bacterium]|nr:UDP-glucose 4-epimerase GalE [Candidatus Saccharibacteria bacterium]
MKILVTGGAGYIGSTVATQLVEAGHEVVVLDLVANSARIFLPAQVRLIEGDIAQLQHYITKDDGIEAVLHLAAHLSAGESMQVPEKYWHNNTVGTLRLLDAMRELGIRKLIFSSTAAVYGNPKETPITEESEKNPTNTYGMTKLATDMAITSECIAHGLAAISLRFFNVAGAYGLCGERHDPETHIIPLAFEAITGKRDGFMLFGDDYPTEDGTCVRDYIHVSDLAKAHILALGALTPGKHDIFNLGNGNGFSNRQVVAAVEKVTGRQLPVAVAPRRAGDPAVLIASSQKARDVLGWQPEKAGLEEIIGDAWKFYTQQQVDGRH